MDHIWGSLIESAEEVTEDLNLWSSLRTAREMKSEMCKAIMKGNKAEVIHLLSRGVRPGDFGSQNDSGPDCYIMYLQRALDVCNDVYVDNPDVADPLVFKRCAGIAKMLYILMWKDVTFNGEHRTNMRCPILTTEQRDQLFMHGESQCGNRVNYSTNLSGETRQLFMSMFPISEGHAKLFRNSREVIEHRASLVHPMLPRSIDTVLRVVAQRCAGIFS